ncbi:TetR/AcrR family transcriptional regulator [Glycomyces buryatensis]|uniref:TetR/AcrR family transcriptional regulator n=1 Tax=Glycomyces buryatensis TaxID=2570927 RepID=A0A4S8Q9P3_9ACTN|nr:TetR/AcrR family transcriptional regulator [Glycomyces buryatensis]THV40171.1 TetR/AcrR family transcriptional regulator [Glycomyces buryatensis]
MDSPPQFPPRAKDRRVRRSRAALMNAAYALVTERDTAAVPVSDIAEAAGVSRQLLYQHYGDRESLLLEAALDLARRELSERFEDDASVPIGRDRALVAARHFAEHRRFYRAVLNSANGFALNQGLSALLVPVSRERIERSFGDSLDAERIDELALFLTGGAAAVVNRWLTTGDDPLDAEAFADRLLELGAMFIASTRTS